MKKATSVSIVMLSLLFTSSQALKNYVQGNPNDPNNDYLKDFAPLKKELYRL